eukprot:365048-Chlamydomonas_euryale.AAC.2
MSSRKLTGIRARPKLDRKAVCARIVPLPAGHDDKHLVVLWRLPNGVQGVHTCWLRLVMVSRHASPTKGMGRGTRQVVVFLGLNAVGRSYLVFAHSLLVHTLTSMATIGHGRRGLGGRARAWQPISQQVITHPPMLICDVYVRQGSSICDVPYVCMASVVEADLNSHGLWIWNTNLKKVSDPVPSMEVLLMQMDLVHPLCWNPLIRSRR